ncbi:hypothetical protein Athai_22810 [Actinocatenispora thailandica]|uniref:DUF5753 domain-containing protein n=1 Tax=Actinocatenispora thailandica TaxID=227318 RepID=A0A7R7HX54_9ACTN|nr:hypothetical protein Athai_22810 [Actinocatenispora thailandica]
MARSSPGTVLFRRSRRAASRPRAARLERQEILDRPSPPLLWAVLDEGVLRRPVGTPDVMRAQLQHLLEMAQRQHIRLQVLPFAAGVHAAMDGAFEVLDLPNREHVVYVEGPGAGRIFISPNVVTQLRLRFDALRGLALSPDDSANMIAATLGEL